jgi:hypothetical protein
MSIKISTGFLGLLTILFIGLKLTHYIDWPWVWVVSPLWIPAALAIGGVLVALVIAVIAIIFMKLFLKDIIKITKSVKKSAEKNVTE